MSARAVELLAYADMVAAEGYVPRPRRLWREPLWWVALAVLTCLVLLSTAMLLIVRRSDESRAQRDRLTTISEQNSDLLEQVQSCVDPAGTCAKRGARTTSEAVSALNRATVVIVECADAFDGDAAIDACIARRLADTG